MHATTWFKLAMNPDAAAGFAGLAGGGMAAIGLPLLGAYAGHNQPVLGQTDAEYAAGTMPTPNTAAGRLAGHIGFNRGGTLAGMAGGGYAGYNLAPKEYRFPAMLAGGVLGGLAGGIGGGALGDAVLEHPTALRNPDAFQDRYIHDSFTDRLIHRQTGVLV